MTDQPKKSLADEIINNARKDRKRLEAIADGLTNGFGQFGDVAHVEGEPMDPEVSAAFAEEVAKVTDSLSKVDQRLLEVMKFEFKEAVTPVDDKPKKMTKEEKEALYEEMQHDAEQKELN